MTAFFASLDAGSVAAIVTSLAALVAALAAFLKPAVELRGAKKQIANLQLTVESQGLRIKELERKDADCQAAVKAASMQLEQARHQADRIARALMVQHGRFRAAGNPARPKPLPAMEVWPSVLVVEDDPYARRAMERLCDSHGLAAHFAADYGAAMGAVEETEFDVILLDLMLPGGDGEDVISYLSQTQAKTRVVVTTGCGGERLEKVKELRPYAVFGKPCDPDALFAAIRGES